MEGACGLAREVAAWRNDRIHPPQIRIVEDQHVFVLCNEKGGPLPMDYSECEAKIRQAVHANTEMQVNVERLMRNQDWWDRNFADIFPDVQDEPLDQV